MKKTKIILSDDEVLAKNFQKVKSIKTVEYYRKSMISGIKSRCGKKKGYKNIKNLFTTESYNIWFNSNIEIIQEILNSEKIPSVERVNSNSDYCPSNCIILLSNINSALGKIHALKTQLKNYQTYIKNNLNQFPKELQNYYKKEYLN